MESRWREKQLLVFSDKALASAVAKEGCVAL